MNVLVVLVNQINSYPPVRNLMEVLVRNGHKVTIITRDNSGIYFEAKDKIKYIVLPEAEGRGLRQVISYIKKRWVLRKTVIREMKNNDVLWTTTDTTVRDLGKLVFRYKHVMQLMELIEDIPALPGVKFLKCNIKKYAQRAYKVVVPEYNRAHIQKTWWELKEVPAILPNKMTLDLDLKAPDEISDVLEMLEREERKIILYQGGFASDRDLDCFAAAIEKVSDQYCFYIMGKDNQYRRELCEKYPDIRYIPFIKPPFHLLVTQRAYIGLLPYVAKRYLHYSVLNALYCAPNKIFEYAACELPMIGLDVPGLSLPFRQYDIGYVCKEQSVDEILSIIHTIDERHEEMKKNCLDFYESVDLDGIVHEILG